MQKLCISFIATVTCSLVLSLASHTLGAEQNTASKESTSRTMKSWRRFKERCKGSRKKSRTKSDTRDGAVSGVEAENAALSDGSLYSEWDSSSTSSGSAQLQPSAEEAPSSAAEGSAEACATDLFSVKLATLSEADVVPVVKHSLMSLGRQAESLGKQRAAYNERVRLYNEDPNPELLLSLKALCDKIRDLKRRIREAVNDLHIAIGSASRKLGKEATAELLLELETVMFDIRLDDAVYVEADAWCLDSEGTVSPDEWWASQVVKEMFSVQPETRRDHESGMDSAIYAGKEAAKVSAHTEAGASDFGAPAENAEDEDSTLVAETEASVDADALPESSEEEESTLVQDEGPAADDSANEDEVLTPSAEAPEYAGKTIFEGAPGAQPSTVSSGSSISAEKGDSEEAQLSALLRRSTSWDDEIQV